MKRLLLVACLLLSCFASAGDYITVTGSGKTFEEAKQQSFRKAIEYKVGATVLSDVETQNYNRVKDDIYIYSAGYVDDYKILKQEVENNIVTLLVDVKVSESKLKNRIISVGKSGTDFEGDRHSTQVATYMQERLSKDKLVDKVMNNYPEKAFTITQGPYTIKLDYYRNPILNIPYNFAWNFDFIKSLRETMDLIQDGSNGILTNSTGYVTILAKDPKDLIIGETSRHYFNDLNNVDRLHNYLTVKQPRIVVELKDMYNQRVYAACFVPKFVNGNNKGFYNDGHSNQIVILGNTKEEGVLSLPVSLAIIDKTSKIELSIHAEFVCR